MRVKDTLLFAIFFILQLNINAQVINNLVVFCNDGEPFTLILNGMKENQNPLTNVRIEGLDLKVYEVKVIFQNPKMKDMDTKLTFFRTGKECVFALNKQGGRKHTLDYISEKEIDGFLNNNPPVTEQMPSNVNTNTQTQVNTVNDTSKNTNTPQTSQFQNTVNNIVSQPTEEGKLKTALNSLDNTTFSVGQARNIISMLSSQQSRLAFAKQVCSKAKDPNIYITILDALVNEVVKLEFQNFLGGKK